jgi:hypothetical protein
MAEKSSVARVPPSSAIIEAKKNPGGWVYEIRGVADPNGDVPANAIFGAWKVNDDGKIVGDFIPNPNFVEPE